MKHALTLAALIMAVATPSSGERIKDIVSIKGVRSNPLTGFGVVVGLNGTGDASNLTTQALNNWLRRHNIKPGSLGDLSSKNIASVAVTASLGPFARQGSTVDLTVSAIGNTKSLQGGVLLATELMGQDRQVHAVGQGAIMVGGFAAAGKSASITKNHVTVGTIPNGGHVEKEELATFVENGEVTLQLRNPDFATANEIAKIVNTLHPNSAHAPDAGAVRVVVPKDMGKTKVANLITSIGALTVNVDAPALVVINERTGTIIVGQNVAISAVAISHGNLTIILREEEKVVPGAPFSKGASMKERSSHITAVEDAGNTGDGKGPKTKKKILHYIDRQPKVKELADAINSMGVTPRDLISIFVALKKAGALQAELKII